MDEDELKKSEEGGWKSGGWHRAEPKRRPMDLSVAAATDSSGSGRRRTLTGRKSGRLEPLVIPEDRGTFEILRAELVGQQADLQKMMEGGGKLRDSSEDKPAPTDAPIPVAPASAAIPSYETSGMASGALVQVSTPIATRRERKMEAKREKKERKAVRREEEKEIRRMVLEMRERVKETETALRDVHRREQEQRRQRQRAKADSRKALERDLKASQRIVYVELETEEDTDLWGFPVDLEPSGDDKRSQRPTFRCGPSMLHATPTAPTSASSPLRNNGSLGGGGLGGEDHGAGVGVGGGGGISPTNSEVLHADLANTMHCALVTYDANGLYSFDVQKVGKLGTKAGKRRLELDLRAASVGVVKRSRESRKLIKVVRKQIPVASVFRLEKALTESTVVRLFWDFKVNRDLYAFADAEARELFVDLLRYMQLADRSSRAMFDRDWLQTEPAEVSALHDAIYLRDSLGDRIEAARRELDMLLREFDDAQRMVQELEASHISLNYNVNSSASSSATTSAPPSSDLSSALADEQSLYNFGIGSIGGLGGEKGEKGGVGGSYLGDDRYRKWCEQLLELDRGIILPTSSSASPTSPASGSAGNASSTTVNPDVSTILQTALIRRKIDGMDNLSIFVGSWNMGNSPPPSDLSGWIPPDKYDLYVIGVQECKYSCNYADSSVDWVRLVRMHVGGRSHKKIAVQSIGEMRLIVLIRRSLFRYVTNVKSDGTATGLAGIYPNKGAVGVSFHLLDSSFCFVNSHLAAHQDRVEQRLAMYGDILRGLHVGHRKFDLNVQFDYLFWFGDLNYRINLPRAEVMALIGDSHWSELIQHDQLVLERSVRRAFAGFEELPIDFAPTYRFVRGSREYSAEPRNNPRIPAYCDRIMYACAPGGSLRALDYTADPTIVSSDHAPVCATFETPLHMLLPPLPFVPKRCPVLRLLNLTAEGDLDVETAVLEVTAPFLAQRALAPVPYAGPLARSGRSGAMTRSRGPGSVTVRSLVPFQTYLEDRGFVWLRLKREKKKDKRQFDDATSTDSQAAPPAASFSWQAPPSLPRLSESTPGRSALSSSSSQPLGVDAASKNASKFHRPMRAKLGGNLLPLKGTADGPVTFDLPLMHRGKAVSILSGQVALFWP